MSPCDIPLMINHTERSLQ